MPCALMCIMNYYSTDIYIYIYIYTHRESLVRNHEPCAKALGNNNINIYIYVCHASGPAKDPFKCATRKRRTGQ